ncbi:FAD-binding protein [Mesorhizobium sp. BR1-1-16]|uniref:FAD-binding protein n=1 Tax=Mesorhizobium sp. BR1-1-16 TaxID=2876653 RepID=UPI001CCBB175|nr:FAD-binding protein [Mesorhizobium sp. BR1-1-16]MBZ9934692.1 FAD-binding protein [Mesorhizobium sp. BR1-1-16]
MTSILLPDSEAELEAIIAEAAATASPIAIHGGGSRDIGRPVQAARVLSTQAMTGVTLYEPHELVLSARAGTPLAEIEALLDQNRQRLAFEPIDYRPLLGTHGQPTIGGVTASNASGPRRIQAGAARDHLIGIRATTGRGETIKSGGRVMKNVTGYDFVKLLAGSWGTLGVLTEVTYKLLPKAETETTLVFEGLDDIRAVEAMTTALGTPFEITGAAHLPGTPSQTLLRFEGFANSCEYRTARLRELLAAFGDAEAVRDGASADLWRAIRDAGPLDAGEDEVVWRISVKPTDGPAVAARLHAELGARYFFDWSGGLVWATITGPTDGGAASVRSLMAALGGHATMIRAPHGLRASIAAFQPEAPAVKAITRSIRESFDPAGVLNPGRMG